MKVLVICARFPSKAGRGDQNRAHLLLRELAHRHDVTVLTTEAPPTNSGRAPDVAIHVVPARRLTRGLSALDAAVRGQPGQAGWMMPWGAWRRATQLAGEAEVTLVCTTRSIRGPLPSPLVIDHVDALSFNMAQRSTGSESLLVRAAARFEARRMMLWEARVASWAQAQVATSSEVADLLPDHTPIEVIPAAWDGQAFDEPADHRRDIDVIFTGDMSYPPNNVAAVRLVEEIMPRVRLTRPDCNVWIVGRHADRLELPSAHTAANVPDLRAYLTRAKVAVAPVEGKGSPFKTLEAAANGAALVAERWTIDCYPGIEAEVAATNEQFAAGILRLLGDDGLRSRRADSARSGATAYTAERVAKRFENLLQSVTSRDASGTASRSPG